MADTNIGVSNGSRRSQTKCTSGKGADISASGSAREGARSLPTVDERVTEFFELYPEKAGTMLVHDAGDDPRGDLPTLRKECAELFDGGDRFPLTWGGALRQFLEWYDDNRDTFGHFSDGEDEFTKELLNSFDPAYLEKYYAKLMALHREIEREYENPHTAMLTLTSSGTYESGAPRGPVDHQLERRAAWRSKNGTTYKRLYDRMNALVDSGRITAWTYIIVEEYHPGPFKANSGYGHDHPVVIADGELKESDFFDVVDAWVSSCPGARYEAHDYRHPDPSKRPVKIRDLDSDEYDDDETVNSAGGYITKYLYPEGGDQDPLEQPIEQLAHHAVKWATNTRRIRMADSANRAIAADLCRQKHERGGREWEHGDPDHVELNDGSGPDLVCSACSSSWGIESCSSGTLTELRRAAEVEPASSGSNPGGDVSKTAVRGSDTAENRWVAPRELKPRERVCGVKIRSENGERILEVEIEKEEPRGWELERITKPDPDGDGELEFEPGPAGGVEKVRVLGMHQLPIGWNVEEAAWRDERGDDVKRHPELPRPDRAGRIWTNPPPGDMYSQEGRISKLLATIRELQSEREKAPYSDEILDLLECDGVDRDLASKSLTNLLKNGTLYKPPSGGIRVPT